MNLDRARFNHLRGFHRFDIDSTLSRHPLAQDQLGMRSGLAWVAGLALLGFAGAYVLSPVASVLFIMAALLEVVYCRLARVTPLKFLVSGIMVGCGALAGWTAVTGEIRALEMAVLFVWMAAWEIGGRNLVNDFADVEEDERLGIKSVAAVYGPRLSSLLTLVFVVLAAASALALHALARLGSPYLAFAAIGGVYLLIWPGLKLWQRPSPEQAMAVFNRASFYPPLMVAGVLFSLYLRF